MSKALMPVGYDSFEELRSSDFYYVDKSLLVKQLLSKKSMVTLITRPRRFGKSLNMSMLECFFDIRKDSKDLFKNLEISKETEICNKWLNKYPTVFVSFKNIGGNTYQEAFDSLSTEMSTLFSDYEYLLNSETVNDVSKRNFNDILNETTSVNRHKDSLFFLTKLMY